MKIVQIDPVVDDMDLFRCNFEMPANLSSHHFRVANDGPKRRVLEHRAFRRAYVSVIGA